MAQVESVCLLSGGNTVVDFLATALEKMELETSAKVEMVVIVNSPDRDDSGVGIIDGLKSAIHNVQRAIVGKPTYYVSLDEIPALDGAEVIQCSAIPREGVGVEISGGVIDRIEAECDVIVHNSVGILKGDILQATSEGVLSYHLGNIREYRGSHAGFWEFMHGRQHGGATLQRLNEHLDAGEIIVFEEVSIEDAISWPEVQTRLYATAEEMLVTAIHRLNDPEFVPERVPEVELGPVYYRADMTTFVKMRYIFKTLARRVAT